MIEFQSTQLTWICLRCFLLCLPSGRRNSLFLTWESDSSCESQHYDKRLDSRIRVKLWEKYLLKLMWEVFKSPLFKIDRIVFFLIFRVEVLFFYDFLNFLIFPVEVLFFSYFSIFLFFVYFPIFLLYLLLNASQLYSAHGLAICRKDVIPSCQPMP